SNAVEREADRSPLQAIDAQFALGKGGEGERLLAKFLRLFSGQHGLASSRSIGEQHVGPPESRRRAAVADGIDLPRLALTVIGRAPLLPIAGAGDSVAGLPQIGGARLVGHARKHTSLLAPFDLPECVAAELEIIALMIDGP